MTSNTSAQSRFSWMQRTRFCSSFSPRQASAQWCGEGAVVQRRRHSTSTARLMLIGRECAASMASAWLGNSVLFFYVNQ